MPPSRSQDSGSEGISIVTNDKVVMIACKWYEIIVVCVAVTDKTVIRYGMLMICD